jgi:hypothetical protein
VTIQSQLPRLRGLFLLQKGWRGHFVFQSYSFCLAHISSVQSTRFEGILKMADGIRFFELNTGAKIPSMGFGTWQADPGIVGEVVTTAIKVFFFTFFISRRKMMMVKFLFTVKSIG